MALIKHKYGQRIGVILTFNVLCPCVAVVFKLGSADQRGSATVSHGVCERIPKSSNCLHGFFTIYDPYVFKFARISQSLSLSALCGSVAVVWHDRHSVDDS